MKKIAIITSGYFPVPPVLGGAVETLVSEILSENESEKQIDLTIYSAFNSKAKEESLKYQSTKIVYIKFPIIIKAFDYLLYCIAKYVFRKEKHMSYRYILQRLFYTCKVAYDISGQQYDTLIYENHMSLLLTLKLFGNINRYRGRFYYHAHNIISGFYGCRDLLEDITGFLCVSEYIKNTIVEATGINNPNKYYILKNRINEKNFKNVDLKKVSEYKKKILGNEKSLILTFVGRLNPEKGIRELLIAFRDAKIDSCKLLVVGSYYFGSNMKSVYEEELLKITSPIADRVAYLGHVGCNVIPCIYAMSDIVIVPSVWEEPAGLTVIEAMTAGKPLITTDAGGIPEYAKEDFAIIVPRNKEFVENLKKALVRLVLDRNLREKLSANARLESKNWTVKKYYYDFLDGIQKNI